MLQGVKNMMVSDIANVVVEYLATLPDGTTISTSDAVDRTLGCKFLSGGRCRMYCQTGLSKHQQLKACNELVEYTNSFLLLIKLHIF